MLKIVILLLVNIIILYTCKIQLFLGFFNSQFLEIVSHTSAEKVICLDNLQFI